MFNWIGSILVGIKNWIIKQFREYMKTDGAEFVAEILPLAKEYVLAAWKEGGTEEGNFQNAKDKLINELKDIGQDYSEYMVNQALEIAWGIVKEELKAEGKDSTVPKDKE